MNPAIILVFILTSIVAAIADDIPSFDSDVAADTWLRKTSASYRAMAEEVDQRGGYKFRTSTRCPRGASGTENGQRWIELNPSLKGADRVSTIAFEITNLLQERKHAEIDAALERGTLKEAKDYIMLIALIEFDGTHLLTKVLIELYDALGQLPPEMYRWLDPHARSFADYMPPSAYDTIKRWMNDPDYCRNYVEQFNEATANRKPKPK